MSHHWAPFEMPDGSLVYAGYSCASIDRWEALRATLPCARRQRFLAAARELGTHTKAEWKALVEETAGRCVGCGETPHRITKDHIVPIRDGGDDSVGNLQPLCQRCNSRKGIRTINWLAPWRERGIAAA